MRAQSLHRLETFLLCFLGISLCLDVPSARAFNETGTWTKTIGRHLFHGFKDLYNIPLPFTLFDLISYGALASVLLVFGFQKAKYWKLMSCAAALIPLAALWAFGSGVVRGQSIGLASTQIHAIPLLAAWLALGYFMGLRESNGLRIFRVLFWASLFKALLGLGIFAFVYDFDLGPREYLIDHASSIYLVCGMAYAAYQMLRRAVTPSRKVFFLFALLILASSYVLNDRRASYAGLIIAVLLFPAILPERLRRDIGGYYKSGLVLAAVVLAAFVIDARDPYSFSGGLKSEFLAGGALSYRHIENFNLLSAVAREPLLGIGFGTPYPQVIELPDISWTFSLFTAIPHNTLFYLWAFAGPLGIACFATFAWMTLLLITRCGAWARSSAQLFYSILALIVATQWMLYVFFDMGLLEARSLMVFGLVIGSLYPQYARHIKEYHNEQLS